MEFYTNVFQHGNFLYYRGIKNGRQVNQKLEYNPTLFIKSKSPKTEWKSLYGDNLDPTRFSSINDAKKYIKTYDGVTGFDVFGMEKFEYQYIAEQFSGKILYDLSLIHIVSIDIETMIPDDNSFPDVKKANVPILLISLQRKGENIVTTFGWKEYIPTGKVDLMGRVIKYVKCDDEKSMLSKFIQHWSFEYPDIITSWKGDTFDIPYCINRINAVLGEHSMKQLSPWGMVRENTIEIHGKEEQVYTLRGITQLDYLQLYKKFSFTPQESYKLEHVANEELGVSKLSYPGTFREFYSGAESWHTFVEYNVRDVQLVDMLDAKFKFIQLVVQMAYMAKCNFQDIFSPVKTWDVFIYSHLHNKKIAIPPKKSYASDSFEGAWVKEPLLGMKNWILSFDATSLYPNVIKQWNISPEKKLGYYPMTVSDCMANTEEFKWKSVLANKDDFTIASNGAAFGRDSIGILPELADVCLSGRKIAKNEMLSIEQKYQHVLDEISRRGL